MYFETLFFPLLFGFFLTIILTYFVIKIAKKLNIVDIPRDRHQHPKITPLMGGVSIALSFLFIISLYFIFKGGIPGNYINDKRLIGLIIGVIILLIGGVLDDKFDLKPKYQIIFPILAILSVIVTGTGINFITNPFGGLLRIDQVKIHLFTIFGIPAFLNLFADLFTFTWLLGTIYTTKFLDGVDGLVAGTTAIGSLVLGFLCLGDIVHQQDTAIICFIISGCYLGFLLFNLNPARIFLGESGSTLSGFLLGTLAIISGGKVAITLLILAVPIIDALIVVISRITSGSSPFKGDRRHLHYKLKTIGLSNNGITLLIYSITMFFGGVGLMSGTKEKMISLTILILSTVAFILWINKKANDIEIAIEKEKKIQESLPLNFTPKQNNINKVYDFDLSLIIINFKSLAYLERQLHALESLDIKIKYEIIIVENASGDNIKSILEKFKNIKLIISKNNLGYGGGINIGTKYAKGKYVLLLNPDIIPHKDALENMFNFMEKNEDVGILAPKLVYPDGEIQNSCYRFYNIFTPIFRRTKLGATKYGKAEIDRVLMNSFNHQETIETDWILGAAFMMNKDFFNKIGGVDERYFLYYEDMDICRSTWLNGKKVVYFPYATMTHDHQRATAKVKNILLALKNKVVIIHIKSALKFSYKFFLR